MLNKYDIKINGNIIINSTLIRILNIVLSLISSMLVIFSFVGNIARKADSFYMRSGIGVSKLIISSMLFELIIYGTYLSIKFLVNKNIKFSILELIFGTVVIISFINYGIYFTETNDKNVVYLFAIFMIITLSSFLVNKIIEYKFWKGIYTEGIKLYGESFKEYHNVELEISKQLTDKEKLDICINKFNFGDSCIVIDLINFKNRYKKYKENK